MTELIEKEKTNYYYKLFRVKKKDETVTTVSIDPVLVTRACQVLGGLDEVSKLVRVFAMDFDKEEHRKCSGFVASKLKDKVKEMTKR